MIKQERLMERIDSWDRHAQQCFEDFQATGSGVYQSRARKYEEYAEIARMALESYDILQRAQSLAFWLRHYKAIAKDLSDRMKIGQDPGSDDFKESLRLMLESLMEVRV